MQLDPDTCERARQARDPRFDGRFFIGVRTTGVYCRPVCRVRTPLRKNVSFYPTAAASEEAGFRPCRRCRPETAPGTPAWLGSSATVSRALRLIEVGALDDAGSVDALAARLGLGARQLRRLFARHVGAAPLSVACTRRTHFARRLLDESDLALAQIAAAAGFGSVRQFNDRMRSTFRRTPTELRAERSRSGEGARGISMRLAFRPPFDWPGLLSFLAPRAIPGVESVRGDRYLRSIGAGSAIEVSLSPDREALVARVLGETPPDLIGVASRLRRVFDLAADPEPIARDLGGDPLLATAIRNTPGLRAPGAWDPFETCVRIVLGQQVSVAGATTLAGRLVTAFGKPLERVLEPALSHLFPSPAVLVEADLASIGLPHARAEGLRSLARAVAESSLPLDGAAPLEATVAALVALPGIGDWTAQVIAMRALGEPDAFPAGDLGLRKALGNHGQPAPERRVRERAEAWRPWRSYAAMWLWSTLGAMPNPRARRKRS